MNGKAVLLSWSPENGRVSFSNASGNANLFTLGLADLRDGVFRDYRVDKFDDGGTTRVRVFIDGGSPVATYSAFDDDISGEGFGLFGTTPGSPSVVVDSFTFGAPIPEPNSVALTLMGIAMLGVFIQCRRAASSLA